MVFPSLRWDESPGLRALVLILGKQAVIGDKVVIYFTLITALTMKFANYVDISHYTMADYT